MISFFNAHPQQHCWYAHTKTLLYIHRHSTTTTTNTSIITQATVYLHATLQLSAPYTSLVYHQTYHPYYNTVIIHYFCTSSTTIATTIKPPLYHYSYQHDHYYHVSPPTSTTTTKPRVISTTVTITIRYQDPLTFVSLHHDIHGPPLALCYYCTTATTITATILVSPLSNIRESLLLILYYSVL